MNHEQQPGQLSSPPCPVVRAGSVLAPQAPKTPRDTGVDVDVLLDLALKTASTVPNFTTEWMVRQLRLPQPVVGELLEQLRMDRFVEVLGQEGPFEFRYSTSSRGRDRVGRLLEISGYIGPAPVALTAYTGMLEWELAQAPAISPAAVAEALCDLVLTPEATHLAGLAASSGRSLFLFGPPGNGKTAVGRSLHKALQGDMWIPHCVGIDSSIIRIFDPQIHEPTSLSVNQPWAIDQRWVRVRRPLIVVGGEATFESFDLAYSPSLRYYEAPVQVKANGGTFLIDDFGRQRIAPHDLLNRWIIPLEHRYDFLSLHTGQKIQVPFRQMLIIATNLHLKDVTDPAFLRRMGYRLHLTKPSAAQYAAIFSEYAARHQIAADPALINQVLEWYQAAGRDLRGCEPRDLIDRVQDICRFQNQPLHLTEELLSLAWMGYFGVHPHTISSLPANG